MFDSLMQGWYHGKGAKYSRNRSYEDALTCYLKALNYAKKGGNLGSIAIETECIALTYSQLNNKHLSVQYAEKGLEIYQTNLDEKPFRDGVERLTILLQD